MIGWDEWLSLDGMALAAKVRSGALSPRDVAAQVTEGVRRVDGKLNAVLEVFADVVANPDADGPAKDGALYPVPIFLKDLGSGLKGRKQESGTKLMRGFVAPATDPLVDNFLAGGMVPIGRSTTPEFGMTFDTATDYLGEVKVTRNPWHLDHTAGGSSGGSAALVAAGVTPVSMASDGGGSTRIPASFCGLVGLKATRGRVPPPLNRNEYMTRISIEGVVTRTVRDTAAAYETLTRVPNGGSFIAMGPPRGSYLDAIARDPAKLRIGLSTGKWGRPLPVDPIVAARVREVAKLLESLGHHVEEIDDAKICDWETMWRGYITQWIGSRASFVALAKSRGVNSADLGDWLGPMVHKHYVASDGYDKFAMLDMMAANNSTTRAFGALMTRHDVLLTPTMAIRVPKANGPFSLLRTDVPDIHAWVEELSCACRYTMPGNESGLPGINVPAGLDPDGLPIGAQLHGNFAAEDTLLALAAQIERAKPEWFAQRPKVNVAG